MSESTSGVVTPTPERFGSPPGDGSSAAPLPLEAVALTRVFPIRETDELRVLAGVELRVSAGEAVAIIGSSGAGKSTLLHLLGGLDRPTSGEVLIGGRSLSTLPSAELAAVRNQSIGFVFQFHHLLREFSALENTAMPMLIAGHPVQEAQDRARDLLVAVGLGERLDHRPWQLSGGEQQRVAVARALVNRPLVLLADEPSGNLDRYSSQRLHDLLFEVQDTHDVGMVLVTHNMTLAERADRVLMLEDGVLVPGSVE